MFAKTVAERTKPGVRQDVEEKQYTFHAYASSQGVAGIIITDPTYPKMVAHGLLSKMIDEFTSAHPRSQYMGTNVGQLAYPQLKEYIVKYQNPEEADSIMKIQQELDATKVGAQRIWTFRIRKLISIATGRATQDDTERACKFSPVYSPADPLTKAPT